MIKIDMWLLTAGPAVRIQPLTLIFHGRAECRKIKERLFGHK